MIPAYAALQVAWGIEVCSQNGISSLHIDTVFPRKSGMRSPLFLHGCKYWTTTENWLGMDKLSFWDMTTGGPSSATNKYLVTEAIMCPFLDQNDPKATGRIQRKMSRRVCVKVWSSRGCIHLGWKTLKGPQLLPARSN